MKLNCIVIDDEPLAVELLEAYVKRTPFLNLVASFNSAIVALSQMNTLDVQVVFCDVQMPQLNGVEFSKLVPPTIKLIFTTAFSQYAVDGFKVNALDYLLKPISYAEFLSAANRALDWFEHQSAGSLITASTPKVDSIFVKSKNRLLQIKLDDLLYAESIRDYVHLYLADESDPVVSLMSLKQLEQQLPADRFMRVHRSYLVQLSKVRVIERNRIVFGKVYIPISENYKDEFFSRLSQLSILPDDK